jgi:phage terminase small subunit
MALTSKQEAFAQAVVTGLSHSDAYRAAFKVRPDTKPNSVNVSAAKLMADPNITLRVKELREPVAKRAQITLEGHLEDLMKLRNMAAKEKQYSAAIAAEVARGKAAGIITDKMQISGSLFTMTDEQLDKKLAEFHASKG